MGLMVVAVEEFGSRSLTVLNALSSKPIAIFLLHSPQFVDNMSPPPAAFALLVILHSAYRFSFPALHPCQDLHGHI